MLKHLDQLHQLVVPGKKSRLAVVFAHDEYVIEAVALALEENLIEPILIGKKAEIETYCRARQIYDHVQIMDCSDADESSKIAMDLVNQNKADIIMKGLLDTKVLLKAVVNKETGIRRKALLSHVGLIEFPSFDRILFATDGAMMIEPSVEEKIAIVENAVELAHTLGYEQPKVGIVSSVEKVNPKILSTIHAQEILAYFSTRNNDFLIDGPFAVDNLVSMESVHHKGITSDVAGMADILLFPNLDGGNIFYKTSVFLTGGVSAGIVIGAKVPIVLTSRADSAIAKYNSILLAVVNQNGIFASGH